MCEQCSDHSRNHSPDLARRTFLKLASAVAFSSAFSIRSEAAESGAPPKPHNVLSPKEALDRLMAGNDRYVKGITKRHDFISERPALTLGQNPFAGILGCADSRVGPEYAFDVGLGDVFVCRGAGNFADEYSIATYISIVCSRCRRHAFHLGFFYVWQLLAIQGAIFRFPRNRVWTGAGNDIGGCQSLAVG
jgi:carbonic anhydrase